jgi:site-specific DNA-methyltransferase (adenine-specific)
MSAPVSFLDGQIQLFLGDAREVVPSLDRRFSVACFDAPYKLTSGGKTRSSNSHMVMCGGWMADYDNSGELMVCDISWNEVMNLVAGCLANDADVYAFANDKNQFEAQRAAYEAGLKFHNLLAWDKRTATANRWYMKNLEFVLYLYTGRARAIANCGDKQLVPFPHRDVTDHPTEKPVPLVEAYIRNSARPGEAVIDPFMGSGTAAVACVRTGNPFVGVEIDPKHFETACRRVERACEGRQCDLEWYLAAARVQK